MLPRLPLRAPVGPARAAMGTRGSSGARAEDSGHPSRHRRSGPAPCAPCAGAGSSSPQPCWLSGTDHLLSGAGCGAHFPGHSASSALGLTAVRVSNTPRGRCARGDILWEPLLFIKVILRREEESPHWPGDRCSGGAGYSPSLHPSSHPSKGAAQSDSLCGSRGRSMAQGSGADVELLTPAGAERRCSRERPRGWGSEWGPGEAEPARSHCLAEGSGTGKQVRSRREPLRGS